VMPVARDFGASAWDLVFDPLLQLLWRSRHTLSVASRSRSYTC
jgi:hypothetical protein